MINFNENAKATTAMEKMKNLSIALGECGIESNLIVDNDENIISLEFGLWNCTNGATELCCVYSAEFEGWEVNSYTDPATDRKAWLEEIDNLI